MDYFYHQKVKPPTLSRLSLYIGGAWMRKRKPTFTHEGLVVLGTALTDTFSGKACKMKVAGMLYGELSTYTFWKQKTSTTSDKGEKRILTTIKKDLAALIKKVFKTASRCKNDDEGQEDMERESSKWWRLELSRDCPVSRSSPGKQLWEKEDQHTCPPGEVYIFKWFASVMNIKVKQVLREQ